MNKKNILLACMLAILGSVLQADIAADLDGYIAQITKAQKSIRNLKRKLGPVISGLVTQKANLVTYKDQKDTYEGKVNSQVKSKFTSARNKLKNVPVIGGLLKNAFDAIMKSTRIKDKLDNLDEMFDSLEALLSPTITKLTDIKGKLEEQIPLMDQIDTKLETTKEELAKVKIVLAPPPPPPTSPAPPPPW